MRVDRLLPVAAVCLAGLANGASAQEPGSQEHMVMMDVALGAYDLATQCQSMFLRNSPMPTNGARVTGFESEDGRTVVTMETDAIYRDVPNTLSLELTDDGGQRHMECRIVIHLVDGSAENVWGALQRYQRGVAAQMTATSGLGPSPNSIAFRSCIDNHPRRNWTTDVEMRFFRPSDAGEMQVSVNGFEGETSTQCLEEE